MGSSDMHAGHALSPNFGVPRLLRRGRFALVFGLLALLLAPMAHARCAVRLTGAGSSGTIAQIGATGQAPAPHHSLPDSDDPDRCLHLLKQVLDANIVPHPVHALPVTGDEPANLTPPAAAHRFGVRVDDRLARNHPFYPLPPPDRPLYLRTSRLLI
jgi:hypothetical protein